VSAIERGVRGFWGGVVGGREEAVEVSRGDSSLCTCTSSRVWKVPEGGSTREGKSRSKGQAGAQGSD